MPSTKVNNIQIPVPVNKGGTGSATAADAAEALGVGVTDTPTFAGASIGNIESGNINVSVSSKTLTITASAECRRLFSSSTAGETVLIDISSDSWSFAFDTAYNSAGCGITETVSWANAMPWFIYLVNGTNASAGVEVLLSRNPCMSVAPAEGYFHYSDAAADTDEQTSVLASYADGTDYSGKPVVLIGALTMTYDTADDDWTPSLATFGGCNEDALRKAFSTLYTMPVGQNEALNDGYLYNALGANCPTWATDQGIYTYTLSREGGLAISFHTSNSGVCTNGNQTSLLYIALPYSTYAPTNQYLSGSAFISVGGAGYAMAGVNSLNTAAPRVLLRNGSYGTINADDFTNSADDILVYINYIKVF